MRKATAILCFIVTALILAAGAWFCHGIAVSQEIRTERIQLKLEGWPAEAPCCRVVVLADLHVARWESEKLDRIIQAAVDLKPDAYFLLGDNLYGCNHALSLPWQETARRLLRLARYAPVFYVTGNHDHGGLYNSIYDQGGFTGCDNCSVRYQGADGRALDISGYMDAYGRELPALPPRTPGVPRLILSHYPYSFLKHPGSSKDAVLAAHTHGGQLCTPSGRPLFGGDGHAPDDLRAGWHRAADGAPLYIPRGIGCSHLPFRLYCPGEITVVELQGQD